LLGNFPEQICICLIKVMICTEKADFGYIQATNTAKICLTVIILL
jgi:hypothetical protein